MQLEPRISFIVPAFNAETTLERAVLSVLKQHGVAYEIIVVDDGSADDTSGVAARLAEAHSEVRADRQANRGTAAALNRGRLLARADYVCSVDADDELTPDYLSTMWAFVDLHPGFGFYSHDLWRVNEQGARERVYGWDEVRYLSLDEFLIAPTVVGPGTLWNKGILEELGGYSEDVYNEDYDLWLRALVAGVRHIYCPSVLYCYHQHGAQKTADGVRVQESIVHLLEKAILSGRLTEEQTRLVRESVSDHRRLAREYRLYGVPQAVLIGEHSEAGAAALRRALERWLPARTIEPALRFIHSFSWIARPIRPLAWRLKARLGRRRARS